MKLTTQKIAIVVLRLEKVLRFKKANIQRPNHFNKIKKNLMSFLNTLSLVDEFLGFSRKGTRVSYKPFFYVSPLQVNVLLHKK